MLEGALEHDALILEQADLVIELLVTVLLERLDRGITLADLPRALLAKLVKELAIDVVPRRLGFARRSRTRPIHAAVGSRSVVRMSAGRGISSNMVGLRRDNARTSAMSSPIAGESSFHETVRTDSTSKRRNRRDAFASASAHARTRPRALQRINASRVSASGDSSSHIIATPSRPRRMSASNASYRTSPSRSSSSFSPRSPSQAGAPGNMVPSTAIFTSAVVGRRSFDDEGLGQLAVDREPRDQLHRGGAHLGRRIALRERDEQVELTMAREHDREVPSHASIGLVARAKLRDRSGRAQRERPDRPHPLFGATVAEKI